MAAMTLSRDFTFCPISSKRNFFGNLDCNFRKCFTKGFYWRSMKNFEISLWRQILHIYRRLLLRTSQVDTTLCQLQLSKSFKMLHKFSSWTHQSNFHVWFVRWSDGLCQGLVLLFRSSLNWFNQEEATASVWKWCFNFSPGSSLLANQEGPFSGS